MAGNGYESGDRDEGTEMRERGHRLGEYVPEAEMELEKNK